MRYLFIVKSNGKQFVYANETEALIDFKEKFGGSNLSCVLRSLVGMCITDFTFENEKIIFKGEEDN